MLMVQIAGSRGSRNRSAFIEATRANASASFSSRALRGSIMVQHRDDPTRFILIEGLPGRRRTLRHKETEHYASGGTPSRQ